MVVGCCVASAVQAEAEDQAADAADQLAQGRVRAVVARPDGKRSERAACAPHKGSEDGTLELIACRRNCLQVMGKILIGLLQMLSELPAALALSFPAGFAAVLDAVQIFLLDVFEVFRIDCIAPLSVHARFSTIMVLPFVGVAIVQLLHCIADARAGRGGVDPELVAHRHASNKAKASYHMFFVIFLLYPLLSRTAFHMTPTACWSLGPDESWHMDDMSVDCSSGVHVGFMVAGSVFIVVYPIGIPLAFLFFLVRDKGAVVRSSLQHESATESGTAATAASSAYDFLKKDYKPAYYYFECVNLLEKLLVRAQSV